MYGEWSLLDDFYWYSSKRPLSKTILFKNSGSFYTIRVNPVGPAHNAPVSITGGNERWPWDTHNTTGLDTSLQFLYHSNELESRPKTKFFSLLIYAGYPIA